MKITQKSLLLVAAIAACMSASAQSDFFAQPRTIVLQSPTVVTGAALTTNTAIDLRQFDGIGKIDFITTSNSVAGTLTNVLIGSTTGTNGWTVVPNSAFATQTSLYYTNYASGFGTNSAIYTNVLLLAGIVTSPAAATAGFATPYLVPAPFTNNASVVATGNVVQEIGIALQDCPRFLAVVNQSNANATNWTESVILTGRKSQ